MLDKRYNAAAKKFPLKDIPIGELVIVKVEPFTPAQLKKDPKLADLAEPAVYGVGMVAKHLKKVTRIHSVWIDIDGFGTPEHVDMDPSDPAVWLAETAMPIGRIEDEVAPAEPPSTLPAGHYVLRARDRLADFIVDHVFLLPGIREPGRYRAVSSYNAQSREFARRTTDREWGDISLSLSRVEDMRGWDPASVVNNHADIWSAYTAVGYDFKKKVLDESKILSGDHE